MFTLRVQWADQTCPQRTVYSASKYAVGHDVQGRSPLDGSEADHYTPVFLDDGAHEVHLSTGDRCYVMNDQGATVDTIFG